MAETAAECGGTTGDAVATPGSVLVEAVANGLEPPISPKATSDQVTSLTRALLRSQPSREKIALTIPTDRVRPMTRSRPFVREPNLAAGSCSPREASGGKVSASYQGSAGVVHFRAV